MIAILLVRCGSSVINHRKSDGSWGGPENVVLSSFVAGLGTTVLRGERPSSRDSAPPK